MCRSGSWRVYRGRVSLMGFQAGFPGWLVSWTCRLWALTRLPKKGSSGVSRVKGVYDDKTYDIYSGEDINVHPEEPLDRR